MNGYFKGIMDTVNKAIEDLDEERFYALVDDTVRVLRNGGKVVITGLGKNAPICEKFVGTMLSFGLESTFLHTNTAVHGDLGTVRDDDIVIILSKSGETAESIYLLEHLKKRKSLIWSMTFNENSRLALGAPNTLALKMDNEGDEWNKVPNNSTTVYLIVLQALAMNVSKKMGVTYEDFIRNHPGGAIGDAAKKQ